ncbi:hypothetical protein SprV_0902737000 [Sparganum proliferum]
MALIATRHTCIWSPGRVRGTRRRSIFLSVAVFGHPQLPSPPTNPSYPTFQCNVIVLVFILYALICRIKRTPRESQASGTSSTTHPRTPIPTNGTALSPLNLHSAPLSNRCLTVNACGNPADRAPGHQETSLRNGTSVCTERVEPIQTVAGTNGPLESLSGATWQSRNSHLLTISGTEAERLKVDACAVDGRRRMSRTHSVEELKRVEARKSSAISFRSLQKLRFRLGSKFSRSDPM